QVFRRTREHKDRYEHNADAQRRHDGGYGDLLSAVQDRAYQGLPFYSHVAVHILDLYRGIVHQDSDSEGKTAERHYVDRLSQQTQNDKRSENGKRNRDADDQRATP